MVATSFPHEPRHSPHHTGVDARQRGFAQGLSLRHCSASNPRKSGTRIPVAAPLGLSARLFLSDFVYLCWLAAFDLAF